MAKDAETSKPKHLDPTSEYYLSSQANSGNSLTKDTLKGDNYVAWEQSAILTLKSHNKLAFIDGRITKPDPESEDFLAWDIVNSTLCSWICNSLDPPIHATVSRLNEAKLIWDSLKTRYSIPNRPRIYKLWSDASMTTQGGASVITYYTKLLGMWEELLTLSPLESCGCPKGTEKMNRYQDIQTYQFLMGLDDKKSLTGASLVAVTLPRRLVFMPKMGRLLHGLLALFQPLQGIQTVHLQDGPGARFVIGWVTHRRNVIAALVLLRLASAAATQNNNPSLSQAQAAATSALPGLTPEQMQRLITFLESSPSGTNSLVGKSLPPTHTWLIDRGASHHMMGKLNFFSSICDIPPSPVSLPDGLQTNAIKAGSVSLGDGITLRHMLYVPNLAVNLISVSCLATDANCFVAFSNDICVLQDRTSKSSIGLGKMHRGVFVFQPLSTATVASVSESESYELWHRRMGHPSSQPLIHLPTVSVVSPSLKTICDVCCRAKHSRTVFPDSTSRAMDIFGLVHCDIWGPYRVSTISGTKYFLTIVDDYSRAVWVYLMHDKGQTGTLLQNFCNMVHTQFGKLVKIIRSDNGHEFDSQPMTQFYNDHDKFSPRSRRCVFLGYPPGKKGWRVYDLETNQVFFSRDVKFEETVFPFTTPLGPSPTPATTTFCPAWDCAEHPTASPPVIGGDTPLVTGGDPPPSPAATPSLGLSGITAGPDPEISSSASPPSSPTAPSPTLGRGKRQKKVPSVLKDYLSTALRSYGFLQSHADHTLFTYRKGDVFLSVLVYVDDLTLAGNNSTAYSSFKKYLNNCFKLKDLGPLKYFLGIEAARGPCGLFLSQRKYALDILSESGLSASKPAAFPMEQNHGLALAGGPLLSDPGPYRRLIGRPVYLTITRPDICYAVHVLSQFMQSPRSQHWDAALQVLRYLKAAPGQGLFLPANSPLQIYAFCDSDWASCPLTRRSVTGNFVSLRNSPISWRTKKQPTVSRSSAEAEYRSMAVTTCELTWLKSFLLSLGVHHDRPIRLFCDNQAALHIASNPVFHERTKHIEIDCHYVREQLLAANISTAHVRTAHQVADIFTKALGRHQFHYLCGKLGIRNLFAPT
ncbi:hypothetical protein RJ639_014941 [Escallonia herrerae]|uniref:Integrase catalytic domain-containing protein n=1 Tax=Escallonia herrerae TaxID=1293975 RepID=A0AA89ANV7_9ASTE|nr:hypothetical protein RJ639_014941 [Escallonia herrerae]